MRPRDLAVRQPEVVVAHIGGQARIVAAHRRPRGIHVVEAPVDAHRQPCMGAPRQVLPVGRARLARQQRRHDAASLQQKLGRLREPRAHREMIHQRPGCLVGPHERIASRVVQPGGRPVVARAARHVGERRLCDQVLVGARRQRALESRRCRQKRPIVVRARVVAAIEKHLRPPRPGAQPRAPAKPMDLGVVGPHHPHHPEHLFAGRQAAHRRTRATLDHRLADDFVGSAFHARQRAVHVVDALVGREDQTLRVRRARHGARAGDAAPSAGGHAVRNPPYRR